MVWKAYTCLNIWFNLTFNAPFWSLINGSKITNLCECLAKSAVISKLLRTRFRPIYRLFLYIVGLYIVMTIPIPMVQRITYLLCSNSKMNYKGPHFLNLRLDRCNSQVENIKMGAKDHYWIWLPVISQQTENVSRHIFTLNWVSLKFHWSI